MTYFQRYGYVAVTLLNSVVTFAKSYLFMSLLSKEELGYMSLFQSMIVIVSFFQIGVIYGGYRLISFSVGRQRKSNDAVVSYLFLLFAVSILIIGTLAFFVSLNWFWIAGIFVGLMSLWTNWVSNMHIALGRTSKLSFLVLSSLVLSFIAMPLLYTHPLLGAVTLIGLQPVFLIVLAYLFNRDFGFNFSLKNWTYLKLTIKLGFIPFLTGILHYVNLQVERWMIGLDLGIKALGDYYLVFVYVGLFAVIPGALGTLNFPKFMKVLSASKRNNFSLVETFKIYYLELIGYLILMTFGTLYVMPWIINLLLPLHNEGVHYVQIIFIGLIFFTLIDPVSFVINAKLHYKPLLTIYIISVSISLMAYGVLYFGKLGSLTSYSYVNVLFYSTIAIGYIAYFLIIGRKSLYNENI